MAQKDDLQAVHEIDRLVASTCSKCHKNDPGSKSVADADAALRTYISKGEYYDNLVLATIEKHAFHSS